MRVVAAELGDHDAKQLQQCKARAAEAVEYCLAMKADAGARWNAANLEATLQFQRILEQPIGTSMTSSVSPTRSLPAGFTRT